VAADDLSRLVLRVVLSLPTPILRALSGGSAIHVGGRTLDPRLQFLASQAARAPEHADADPVDARIAAARSLSRLAGPPERGVRIETLHLPGAEGDIPARVYRPEAQDPSIPILVFAHFGGGVVGDLDSCETFCTILAGVTRGPVLSIGYRLAPEHRFPAGLDDMLAAYRWARDNATHFGAPTGRAAIGGDSMGGNFAAVVAQDLKRAGEAQPVLQLLIYPALDLASESPSMTTYAGAYPLSRATLQWFMGHYVGPDHSPTDPRLSPLRAEGVSGLAPAIIVGAGFDPLLDQGEAYALRLQAAGSPVTYRCYDNLAHGFTAFTGAVPAADLACRQIATLVRDAAGRGAEERSV
jgi:acetyl esterase/lipase